jgi:hypothetical protein
LKFLCLGSKTMQIITLILNALLRGCSMRIQNDTGAALLSSEIREAQLSAPEQKYLEPVLVYKFSICLHDRNM